MPCAGLSGKIKGKPKQKRSKAMVSAEQLKMEVKMATPEQKTVDWEKLKGQVAPSVRGILAAPLTEGEQRLRQYQLNRQGIVDAIHIIVETLPFVHPDWLLEEVAKLGEGDLVNIARLQFIQLALKNLGRMEELQQALIASEEKNFKDQGIEIPKAEGFTLDTILTELAQRVAPVTQRRA